MSSAVVFHTPSWPRMYRRASSRCLAAFGRPILCGCSDRHMTRPLRRFEDKRLLSGNGRFQSDNSLHGQVYAYVLRSPHAHARIRKLDLAAAQAAPGVALIMTGDDLVEANLGVMGVPFQRKRPDGSPMFARAFLGLAQGTVRYVGEPVAFVLVRTQPACDFRQCRHANRHL